MGYLAWALAGVITYLIGWWPLTVLCALIILISLIAQAYTPRGIRWR